MRKLLVAVDGSQHSDHAVLFAVNFVKEHGPVEIHLINVEPKPVAWQTRGMEPESIRAHLATLSHETMRSAHDILKAAERVFWGGYSGYFADPDGHVWEVALNPEWTINDDGTLSI